MIKFFDEATHPQWLPERTIFVTWAGSHAYGTNTPTSDEDFRGIAIPPKEYFLGTPRFDQWTPKAVDVVIYGITKFFDLAKACNPNIIELLFTDPSQHLICTDAMEKLLAHRYHFLSRKARHTFAGYAKSQLNRIKGHRAWILNPPKAPPTRADFGLPDKPLISKDQLNAAEALVREKTASWWDDTFDDLDDAQKIAIKNHIEQYLTELEAAHGSNWEVVARHLGMEDNFIAVVSREKGYRAKKREWKQYQTWLATRNPVRAQMEKKYGFDCKHGMHLVRLLSMCAEILEKGEVNVKRPDAEFLLSIRNGAWTYDELIEWADKQEAYINEITPNSPLPKEPDYKLLDNLLLEIVEESLR